jgi:hypothetical protein
MIKNWEGFDIGKVRMHQRAQRSKFCLIDQDLSSKNAFLQPKRKTKNTREKLDIS